MSAFFRFPHTPHLLWLGSKPPREDKVLAQNEVRSFLSSDVIIEEKVDGANLGISLNEEGDLVAQNRGSFVEVANAGGQWKPLHRWLTERRFTLLDHLTPDLIVFGEWCYARHSIAYDRLPDWYLGFDVYERSSGRFWSVARRNKLLEQMGMATAPLVATGRFGLNELQAMMSSSKLTNGPAEGIYVRRDEGDYLAERAKVVQPGFVQAIDEHWSRRAIEANGLVGGYYP